MSEPPASSLCMSNDRMRGDGSLHRDNPCRRASRLSMSPCHALALGSSSVKKASESLRQLAPNIGGECRGILTFLCAVLAGLGVRGHRKKRHLTVPKIWYVPLRTRFSHSMIYKWALYESGNIGLIKTLKINYMMHRLLGDL